jgi:large subunit ribosomal protein L9
MKVILLKDLPGVGYAGELKDVKDGFARNFLFPKKIAASPADLQAKEILAKKAALEKERLLAEKEQEKEIEKLANKKFVFKKKVDPNNRLYGSVGPKEIAEKTGVEEKYIKTHFKEVGEFPLEIKIGEKTVGILIKIEKELAYQNSVAFLQI